MEILIQSRVILTMFWLSSASMLIEIEKIEAFLITGQIISYQRKEEKKLADFYEIGSSHKTIVDTNAYSCMLLILEMHRAFNWL